MKLLLDTCTLIIVKWILDNHTYSKKLIQAYACIDIYMLLKLTFNTQNTHLVIQAYAYIVTCFHNILDTLVEN